MPDVIQCCFVQGIDFRLYLCHKEAAQLRRGYRAAKTQRMGNRANTGRAINGEKGVVQKENSEEQADYRAPGGYPQYQLGMPIR